MIDTLWPAVVWLWDEPGRVLGCFLTVIVGGFLFGYLRRGGRK